MSLLRPIPRRDIDELVLPDSLLDEIASLCEEYEHRSALLEHRIAPRTRLLLHGPAGCGKTSLAAALGGVFGRRVLATQIGAVRDKYLGQTGQNLVALFEMARGSLLLLDELDALGSKRGGDEATATEREENANLCVLLNALDDAQGELIVGATNRVDALDPALRRRFDCELELPAPTQEIAERFARELFERHSWTMPAGWGATVASFDAIEKAVVQTVRLGVIEKAKGEKS